MTRIHHIHAGGDPAFCLGDWAQLERRVTLECATSETLAWPDGAAICLGCINFGKQYEVTLPNGKEHE